MMERFLATLPLGEVHRVSVRWVTNTGPYRKLIPALREAGFDDLLVTADDDIFYGREWLATLLNEYDLAGGCAVAARVRRIRKNHLGKIMSYGHWEIQSCSGVMATDYLVTFGGGSVLKKSMFRAKDIADDSFLKIAPTTDDIWYSRMLKNKDNAVVVAPSAMEQLNFVTHNHGLNLHNLPRALNLLSKVRKVLWESPAGVLGVSVSENDRSYFRIEEYFQRELA
tara:strand:- start:11906 stop:12580 length:675 start_codon:yes stop_codon:yes gene_type:complete